MKKIVVIGAGFAGLNFIKSLGNSPQFEIVLIDKENHHVFQPLLYQVATAGLTPAQISSPVRGILRNLKHCRIYMDEVIGIDTFQNKVKTKRHEIDFDYLVIASGAGANYFSHPTWEKFAPSLKTISDATMIRKQILESFELAEEEIDEQKKRTLMNFAIVGAGPTGVEIAGAISELANKTLKRDFRNIEAKNAQIFLIEAGPRVLATFSESISKKVESRLKRMGVQIYLNSRVSKLDERELEINGRTIQAHTIIWAAGVQVKGPSEWINSPTDGNGRIETTAHLRAKNAKNIFILGDAAHFEDQFCGILPGLAPVAIQQGRYLGKLFKKFDPDQFETQPGFRYFDKGSLATVGRSYAVAQFGKLEFAGFFAWIIWSFVHILYLIGFRNRIFVMLDWAWAYFTFNRGARLIVRGKTKEGNNRSPLC